MPQNVILDSPVRLHARRERERSPQEVAIRYAAAYASTLIAVAASQLVLHNDVVLLLAAITVFGLPLSLWLRRARALGLLQIGGRPIPRSAINAGVMSATVGLSAWVLSATTNLEISRLFDLSSATQTVSILMEAFLIFGVCRCLAILNEKDAVLCTVPSFSVLLLLVVIHKQPEVVAYFALWAVTSAVLLSLDFRHDVRRACTATVPGLAPNQELKLSARALATVLGFSLSAAGVLSYALARDDSAGADEGWLSTLALRLNTLSSDISDSSASSGPERQIDFSSSPSLPGRTPLWGVTSLRTRDWRPVMPRYWRLFALTLYDGRTWSQSNGPGRVIKEELLGPPRWVNLPGRSYSARPRFQKRSVFDIETHGLAETRARYFGSAFSSTSSTSSASGASPVAQGEMVMQWVRAYSPNTGFLPMLPGALGLRFRGMERPAAVRERADASIDVGVMRADEGSALLYSRVPRVEEYGFPGKRPPIRKISDERLLASIDLPARQKQNCLRLPASFPPRVREWARQAVSGAGADESNYRRALRLSEAVQRGAFYTLSPPLIPEGRDATDFFLFDSRRGYCTYFAGALAAVCRTQGIPSRIVSGFTNPEWQQGEAYRASTVAVLRESGSHAWVEVWEPGWGWAMLDPTPSESRGNNAPSIFQSWSDFQVLVAEFVSRNFASLRLAIPLSLAAVVWLVLGWKRRVRLQRAVKAAAPTSHSREDALARAQIDVLFGRASRRLARVFRPRAPWETPSEWIAASRHSAPLRDEEPVRTLFELYALSRFSPNPLGESHLIEARAAFARIKWAHAAPAAKLEETPSNPEPSTIPST